MILDHPEIEPFEPLITTVLDTSFASGIAALASVGLKLEDITPSESARRRFIRGCHYGYDRAQKRIGGLVLDLEEKITMAEHETKQLRRMRDTRAKAALERIRVLRDRQLVLRRIVDAILYMVVDTSSWILRRFILDDRIRRIDPRVLKRTVEVASERNRQSRYRFNLVADLSTIAHIGDIVEIDLTPGAKKRWRVIELKEGKINEALSGILEDKAEPLSEEEVKQISTVFGSHASKQAHRMVVQQSRLKEFTKIVETDRGIDPALKREILITPDPVEPERYFGELRCLVNEASAREIASVTIDSCLHLVGIKRELIERTGLPIAVAHVFFHLANPGVECKLTDADEGEIRALALLPPIVDLVDHSMRSQWGLPVFLWGLSENHVIDLIMGRISVFAQFDIEAFFRLAAASSILMTWLTSKDGEKCKRLSARIPGSPNAYGVRVELPDGTIQEVLSGFFARVISDLTRPQGLLALVRQWPEQLAKIKRSGASGPSIGEGDQS